MQTYPWLDSKQCEAFLCVIDTGSFELAAQLLHLTTSAISQRVKALEIQLGTTLLVRSRPCRATHAGQTLVRHLRRTAEMEQDLRNDFAGEEMSAIRVALGVNADSVGSWLLPALAEFLIAENILLEISIDDQTHTHDLLESGMVLGCISAEAQAMRGCEAHLLGVMRYHAVASEIFCQRWFEDGIQRDAFRKAPVMTFNRKDKLQSDFLLQEFGLGDNSYPLHFVPATAAYNQAICLGMGWGMIPELMLKELTNIPDSPYKLQKLLPDKPVDIALYWHHWKVQTPRLNRLSALLRQQAGLFLRVDEH
ncbi:HTH-type transcriptional regulator ArgP [Undibacterium sp. SXout7W]|uniref:HTH-type transcriptional regulator ArgP n=1 Tax=Undibacterium sp. SXout7W TaxID=3413049 RepID=UPI003BF088D2